MAYVTSFNPDQINLIDQGLFTLNIQLNLDNFVIKRIDPEQTEKHKWIGTMLWYMS